MDAGVPRGISRRQEVGNSDLDEIPLVTLDSDGEIQVTESKGALPPPAAPYVISSDDYQPLFTASNVLVTTAPITQLSPSMATSSPVFLSQDLPLQSELGTASNVASTTTTVYTDTAASQSTSVARSVYTEHVSSQLKTPASPITVHLSSDLLWSSFAARTTLSSASSSLLTSSSFMPSAIPSSLGSSITVSRSSIHTIVISTSSALLSSSSGSSSFILTSSTIANSSTMASSASSSQPASVTVVAPPFTGKESNLNVHSAPYYVGIVFGTIAGIALLAALIAWWIRLQSHAKRRQAATTRVPWARSGNDDDGRLEAGNSLIDPTVLGSREGLAHMQAWTPRGDRDVGEPKRADGYFNSSTYSLHNHTIPGFNLFSAESLGALSSYDGYHPSSLRPSTQRQLPAHLIDEDAAARAMQDDGSYRHNGRVNVANPGYLDLDVPCNQRLAECPSRPMVERLRNLGKHPTETPWEDPGRLPTPGGSGQLRDSATIEAWSSSFKSSLANAFNAVAANLAGAPRMTEDDKLTAPPKRTSRKSLKDTFGEGKLTRDDSVSTVKSKAWTLEEIGDGAGIVHILNNDDLAPQRPTIPAPKLSFGDGDSISTYDDRTSDAYRIRTQESQIPLIASSKPKPVHVRPEANFSKQICSEPMHRNPVSRNSSVYSTASLRGGGRLSHGVFELPYMPPGIGVCRSQSINFQGQHHSGEIDSVVIRPDTISRLSSTDSSVVLSAVHGDPKRKSRMDVAAEALKDRQKRAIPVDN